MPARHTARPGDHITRIAQEHGFGDPMLIWDDGANAGLKDRRGNPSGLLPGDVVHILDRAEKLLPVSAGRVHTFRIGARKLFLRLVVQGNDGEPLNGTGCAGSRWTGEPRR